VLCLVAGDRLGFQQAIVVGQIEQMLLLFQLVGCLKSMESSFFVNGVDAVVDGHFLVAGVQGLVEHLKANVVPVQGVIGVLFVQVGMELDGFPKDLIGDDNAPPVFAQIRKALGR
jgi:uncharacterized membrane protein